MTQLAMGNVINDAVADAVPICIVRQENELGFRIDKLLDEPGTGDPIDLNFLPCDPSHTETSFDPVNNIVMLPIHSARFWFVTLIATVRSNRVSRAIDLAYTARADASGGRIDSEAVQVTLPSSDSY